MVFPPVVVRSARLRSAGVEPLDTKLIDTYERDGFVKVRSVFDAGELSYYRDHLSSEVLRRNTNTAPIEERDTYHKAFLQVTNLWRTSGVVRQFVYERRLADIARYREMNEPYELGEVSFHSGWTFHHTGANTSAHPRAVMTVIYMADGIRLIEPQRKQHVLDWEAFMPGVHPGDVVDSPLNPLLN